LPTGTPNIFNTVYEADFSPTYPTTLHSLRANQIHNHKTRASNNVQGTFQHTTGHRGHTRPWDNHIRVCQGQPSHTNTVYAPHALPHCPRTSLSCLTNSTLLYRGATLTHRTPSTPNSTTLDGTHRFPHLTVVARPQANCLPYTNLGARDRTGVPPLCDTTLYTPRTTLSTQHARGLTRFTPRSDNPRVIDDTLSGSNSHHEPRRPLQSPTTKTSYCFACQRRGFQLRTRSPTTRPCITTAPEPGAHDSDCQVVHCSRHLHLNHIVIHSFRCWHELTSIAPAFSRASYT